MTWCQKVCVVGGGGVCVWLPIKSVLNTLSCCFVCVFIIGQYHNGNNMSSKSGAAGEILISESEKRHRIRPLKTDMLTWVLLMLSFTYMVNQNMTSVTDLHRGDIALHSAYVTCYWTCANTLPNALLAWTTSAGIAQWLDFGIRSTPVLLQ